MIVFFSKNDEKNLLPAGIRTIDLPIHYLINWHQRYQAIMQTRQNDVIEKNQFKRN